MKRRKFLLLSKSAVILSSMPSLISCKKEETKIQELYHSKLDFKFSGKDPWPHKVYANSFITELQDHNTRWDFEVNKSTFSIPNFALLSAKPINLQGAEAFMISSTSYIRSSCSIYAQFSKAKDLADPNFGTFRFRIWSDEKIKNGQKLKDYFGPIPIPTNATHLHLAIHGNPNFSQEILKDVSVKLIQTIKKFNIPNIRDKNNYMTFSIPKKKKKINKGLLSSGIILKLPNVKEVRFLDRKHIPSTLPIGFKKIFGSAHPISFIISDINFEEYHFSCSSADMISIEQNQDNLLIEIFDYHLIERTIFTSAKAIKKNKQNYRYNPNRGVRKKTQINDIKISFSKSKLFVISTLQPNCSLATLVITDHADYHDPELEKLLMIKNKGSSKYSFNGIDYQLPYTKSIFCTGEDYDFKRKINGINDIPITQASYMKNKDFKKLIDDIVSSNTKIEFGLHTAETRPHTADVVQQSIEDCKSLNLKVWIDHGANKTMIMRLGADTKSKKYFILDILRKSKINYIWAGGDIYPFVDTVNDFNLIRKNGASPIIFVPDGIQKKDSKKLNIFNTLTPLNMIKELSGKSLEKLINERAIIITHSYLNYSLFKFNITKNIRKVALKNSARKMFNNIKDKNEKGYLHVESLAKWGEYFKGIRKVHLMWEGTTLIALNYGSKIEGFTVALLNRQLIKKTIMFLSKLNKKKIYKGVLYISFDLKSGKNKLFKTM